MYEVAKPLRFLHLAYVMLNLWQRGRDELEGLALTREQAFVRCAGWASLGPAGALLYDSEPVFVSGVVLTGPESPFTWFQATEAFERHAREITRLLRREVAAIPGEIYIYSQCIHPKTERWFKVLGFVRDEWESVTATGRPLYRFRRR